MSNNNLGYVVCPVENRQALLLELLSRYWDRRERCWNKKIVLVFCHDNSVRYYVELFRRLKDLPVMPILSGDIKSAGGVGDYATFREAETGVLAVSSKVAARLPSLAADTIIHHEPPRTLQEVSRLGSCCSDSYLLFLRPQETSFLQEAQQRQMVLEERFVPWGQVPKLSKIKLQQYYKDFHSMNINSKASYKAYLDAIRDHDEMKEHFNMDGVDIKEVAEGYCFDVTPHYKVVKETPRYELDQERKAKRADEPLPKTAKIIKTTFKRVIRDDEQDHEALMAKRRKKDKGINKKGSKKRLLQSDSIINEDGTVELGRVANQRLISKRRMAVLKKRNAEVKGLNKQLLKASGGKRSSKRGSSKRRRPL